MELNEVQRLILHNQYEILKRIDPTQEKDYDLLLECLYSGYDDDLEQLLPHFEPRIEPIVKNRVRQILQMFRALTPSYQEGDRPSAAAVFIGFDGNEEGEYYSYARFLLERRELWRESRIEDYNTHYPVLPSYLKMLEVWEALPNQFELKQEEIQQIVQYAPHASRRE